MEAPPPYTATADSSPFLSEKAYYITEKSSSSEIDADLEYFRVQLFLRRRRPAYTDPEGRRIRGKLIKRKSGYIMMHPTMTFLEFNQVGWNCVIDTFNLHGKKPTPHTLTQCAFGGEPAAFPSNAEWKKWMDRILAQREQGEPRMPISFFFEEVNKESVLTVREKIVRFFKDRR